MRGLKTFGRGGVHPHDFKHYARDSAIRNAPVPAVCTVAMQQHLGAPAECAVNVGDAVTEGMLIGKSTGLFSANVHAPIPGKVSAIKDIYLHTGMRSKAAVIELEGQFDRSGKAGEPSDWQAMSPESILSRIQQNGIVGLGGAAFPTHIKYTVKGGMRIDTFVANGVECEPFLTADHRLMLEKAAEITEAMRIVARLLEPSRVLIGIEANKLDAVEAMRRAFAVACVPFEVVALEVRYPQGDEKQLLQALTGREVPSGGLPLDIGCVVSNVGSLFAIYEAVVLDKPLMERIVTVTGSAVRDPSNLKVRIGTRIGELVEECGGFSEPPARLVAGGPMMGFAVHNLDAPVTKGVSGVVALTRAEAAGARQTACLSCGACVASCPLGLSPALLFKWIDHEEYDEAKAAGLLDCKECGCCAYVCPAQIPLVQGMRLGKAYLRKKKA